MDFEYTSRPSVTPIWARGADAESRKRPHTASSPFAPPPDPPRFGAGTSNTPFIFSAPPPPPPAPTGWAPPPDFSPAKAFPDVPDVDMAEPQPDAARPVAAGALRRVFRKREARRRAAERVQDVSDEDSDDDDELVPAPKTPRRARIEKHYTVNMSHGVAPQSELPVLLLGYLQFFFNLALILVFLYLLVQFILTVQRDVEQRISEHSLDIAQEISACAANYRTNLCAEGLVPAMAHQCAAWEQCMARDPSKVGRARVGAELVAEVVNGFVEPISWKTLAFTLSSLAFLTLFVNTLLTLYRGRLAPHPPPAPPAPHAGYAVLPPYAPSPAPGLAWPQWRPDEALDTPSRRRKLEGGAPQKVL